MKNIFISNLSFKLNNEDLLEAFEAYGEVSSAKVVMDKYTGRSRGFGFVEMPDDEEAEKAITELNGKSLDGKAISVAEAPQNTERRKRVRRPSRKRRSSWKRRPSRKRRRRRLQPRQVLKIRCEEHSKSCPERQLFRF